MRRLRLRLRPRAVSSGARAASHDSSSFTKDTPAHARPRLPSLAAPPPRPLQETNKRAAPYARDGGEEAGEENGRFFYRPPTAKKRFPADRPPPAPVPHAFAASVLTAVMSSPDGAWGGRRRAPSGGWSSGPGSGAPLDGPLDGLAPVGVPLPPPPPVMDYGRAIGPGVVAPKRAAAPPTAPNPLRTLTGAQMQPALQRMAAVRAGEVDDDGGARPPPPPRHPKGKGKAAAVAAKAATKAAARAATVSAAPPLRVRYSHQHVVHPWSTRFLDGMAVSMPLPGPGRGSSSSSSGSPYASAAFSGFATQHHAGAASSSSLRSRPPSLSMSFPHCLGGLTTQRYVEKHRAEPLWLIILVHHAFSGPLALPSRSPLIQHCMKRRVKRIFFNALRRRGYDGLGRPLAGVASPDGGHLDRPPPTTPLYGTVSFDGLVPIVLKLPQPRLEAFMDGVVDVLEGLLGKADGDRPPTPARPRGGPGGTGGLGRPDSGSKRTKERKQTKAKTKTAM